MRPLTPILCKHQGEPLVLSREPAYLLLTANGLFLCRNEEFYVSSVPARAWPAELAPHASFLQPKFPRIPQAAFERIVGLFREAASRWGSEAAVLLAWHRVEHRVVVIVPEQRANSHRVAYEVPALPRELCLFGDVHSHVDGAAYASQIDAADELNRPGLHVVVGRVRRQTPDIYVAAVVDGQRFDLEFEDAIEGFSACAEDVPTEWIEKVGQLPRDGYRDSGWWSTGVVGGAWTGGTMPPTDRGPFVIRPTRTEAPPRDAEEGGSHG